jgi:hypothetical protein
VDLDSKPFVAADRAPDCTEEPCESEKTACVVKALGEWLTRDCRFSSGESIPRYLGRYRTPIVQEIGVGGTD